MEQSALFKDAACSGPYRLNEKQLPALEQTLSTSGIQVIQIQCQTGSSLPWMQQIASALAFPDTLGINMDALYDYLSDPAIVPRSPLLFVFHHPEQIDEDQSDILIAVMQAVADEWRETNTPLWAVFISSKLDLDPLPLKLSIA